MIRALPRFLMTVLLTLPLTAMAGGGAIVELPQKPPAPALGLTDLEGAEHRLVDYAGRVIVVNFWATWCGPCREEFPALQALADRLADEGVAVVGVHSGDDRERIRAFLADTPVSFPILVDTGSRAMGRWQVQGLPTTYIVTPDGRIHGGYVGALDWSAPAVVERVRALATAGTDAGADS